jgi:hypothetical protein
MYVVKFGAGITRKGMNLITKILFLYKEIFLLPFSFKPWSVVSARAVIKEFVALSGIPFWEQ